MSDINIRTHALALCLLAGATASAGVFSPNGTKGKNPCFPYLPQAETSYLPKSVDANGVVTPDMSNSAEYSVTSNTVGSVFTPSGEEWYYVLDLEGTRLNPGNPYFVDMDYTGFTVKIYDPGMNLKGQAKGDIIRPEGTLKCRSVEVGMQLTTTFFNTNYSDYEVMLTFSFNPDKDANGSPRYGAKETTQVYSLTETIPANGSQLLFHAPGYYTTAINMGTASVENYMMAFIEDTSWDGEDVSHTHLVLYKKAGYGTSAHESKRFTVDKLLAMSDGNNDAMPFSITRHGNDILVATALYEKTFLKDPTASDPEQNTDNNYIIKLYKSAGDDFELQSTTKIPVEMAPEGYYYRSYALGNFLASDDITFEFGDGENPCYIITIVDADNTEETTAHYAIYDKDANVIKTFGEESDGFVQFDAQGNLDTQFGFYMPTEDNYGIVVFDYPSFKQAGFIPTLFEYESEAWNLASVPARTQTPEGIFYVASVLPSGDNGEGANHFVAWFNTDGSIHHLDKLYLGENVGKVLTYIHHSVLSPYLFNTDKNIEYLAWIYRFLNGTSKTSLELAVVDAKGNILASRLLPDGHSYENAYVSNAISTPTIVIMYHQTNANDDVYKMEFVRLPLNDFEGEGTVESPYIVKTFGDLNRIRFNLTSHFRLANSIDCSGQTFLPIEGEFTGSIDGGNFEVRNLTVANNGSTTAMFAAFGHKAAYDETPVTTKLSNINFVNLSVNAETSGIGTKTLGLIAASMNNAELHSVNIVNSSMATTGNVIFGMVAGYADNVSYTNSYIANADIDIPSASTIGGAFGEIRNGAISKVSFSGKINGRSNVGGLVGKNAVGTLTVSDCHVNAEITGQTYVGGIAGDWNRERINRVFVEGTINAQDYVGGIAGSIGIFDSSRENIEDDNYAIIDNSLVGLDAINAADNAKYAHRLFGYSVVDLGDRLVWVPDPNDNEKGEYVETPAAEESRIGKNYIVSDLAANAAGSVSEGETNTTGISDPEWLAGLGYAVAEWASQASEARPWIYISSMPALYFEGTSTASLHITDAELTGRTGTSVVATLVAENVEFEDLAFESSNPAVAELADLTFGDNGAVNVLIQLNAVGNADITFSYGATLKAVVHVASVVPALSFSKEEEKGSIGTSLDIVLKYDYAEFAELETASSDGDVASVKSVKNGKRSNEAIISLDLKKVGSAELTASAAGYEAKILITVTGATGVDDVVVSVMSYNGTIVSAEGCTIEVFDLQGRTVAAGNGSASVAHLSNGVYVARATNADGATATMKISK